MPRVWKLLLIVAAAVMAVAPLPRDLVERAYARVVYPVVQPRLTALSNVAPFALFDLVVLLGVGLLVAIWTVRLLRAMPGSRLRTAGGLVVDSLAIAAFVYLWFLAAWGLNYQRQPLHAQLDFQEDRITRERLRDLAVRTIDSLNLLYRDAHGSPWPEFDELPAALAPAFASAQQDLDMRWRAEPARPKLTLLNFYFTRVSIDGMTGPFFLETLANGTLLPFERASTMAHEWSHLAGFADESEASFVAWLVCMRGTPAVQYSGWLSLYGTVMNALPPADRQELSKRLDPGPRGDLLAVTERIRRQTVPIASRAGYALYDRFLKANRVESGVRSYGEVLRLLLGTRFDENGRPVVRKEKGERGKG